VAVEDFTKLEINGKKEVRCPEEDCVRSGINTGVSRCVYTHTQQQKQVSCLSMYVWWWWWFFFCPFEGTAVTVQTG
jgi:hypothetical protein